MTEHFSALVVRKSVNRTFTCEVEKLPLDFLPQHEVTIKVHYSSLNYKDLMSCAGNPAVTRRFPHIPGTDAAGVVTTSQSPLFSPGDKVMVTCFPMGMNHFGGFSDYVSVPASWVMPLPSEMTMEHAMAFGTAGYTAAMCVDAMAAAGIDNNKKIMVTGITGGVGCIAAAILCQLGYQICADFTTPQSQKFATQLGATVLLEREKLLTTQQQNLANPRWHAAIDVAGGICLENLIKMTDEHGVIAAVGNSSATQFSGNVLPFILRAISIVGINAELSSGDTKNRLWHLLATDWKPSNLTELYNTIKLAELPNLITHYQTQRPFGRIVVAMEA
ncbi:YhdH/YhfP family quinone oxidoreductase [Pseudoalteromonas xiamenensis]